jgi:hypothetical protein
LQGDLGFLFENYLLAGRIIALKQVRSVELNDLSRVKFTRLVLQGYSLCDVVDVEVLSCVRDGTVPDPFTITKPTSFERNEEILKREESDEETDECQVEPKVLFEDEVIEERLCPMEDRLNME